MNTQRKPIFFTSDWHLGHQNCLNFDNRPFDDLDHMHKVLRNNFNASVPENGLTYMLGDVGMKLANSEFMQEFIKSLNGDLILIIGNHDGTTNKMLNMGFKAVMYSCAITVASRYVTLSHCPKQGVFREDTTGMRGSTPGEMWHGELKNRRFSVLDNDQFHLHGHLHCNKLNAKIGKQWDVGVVGNNYTPVSISKVESWIATHKKHSK